jgi:hypothetical protein
MDGTSVQDTEDLKTLSTSDLKFVFLLLDQTFEVVVFFLLSYSLITRNSTHKMDKWDNRGSNSGPLHI